MHDGSILVGQLEAIGEDLLQVGNLVAHLSMEISKRLKIVNQSLAGAIRELTPETVKKLDFEAFKHLTEGESLELTKLEEIRLNLAHSWRYLESRRQEIIRAAKGRAEQ